MRMSLRCRVVLTLLVFFSPVVFAQKKGSATTPASASPAAAAPASSSGAFESQMLAFGSMDLIAGDIANRVCVADPKLPVADLAARTADITKTPTIVIFDQTTFASIQSYEGFVASAALVAKVYNTLVSDPNKALARLKTLNREHATKASGNKYAVQLFDRKMNELTVTGPAFGDPISDATSLLSALAISSNTESAGSITIPDSAMAVALTRSLKAQTPCSGKTIVYPPLFGYGSISDTAKVDIESDIEQVLDMRRAAHEDVDAQNIEFMRTHPSAPATPAVPATPTTPAAPAKPATPGAGDTVLTAALTDADGLFDNFMNSLLQVNSTSGIVGSAAVIQGRQLATLIAGETDPVTKAVQPPAYVLLATIVAAGGTTHQHKTFWTALTTGDKFTYSGGMVVGFALWKAGLTSPIMTDMIRYRSPLMKIKAPAPADLTGIDAGDTLKH
jgi:hypothetical protein